MINQLKLLILLNKYKWVYVLWFIIAIIFDFYIFYLNEKNTYAPYSLFLSYALMLNYYLSKNNTKKTKMQEFYFSLPLNKKSLILGEYLYILILHLIAYLFWTIELISYDETILCLPLLYIFTVSFLLNCVLLCMYFFNFLIGFRIIAGLLILGIYFSTFWIFYPIKNIYLTNHIIAEHSVVNFWPILTLTIGLILSILIISLTLKYSKSKHMLWSD